MNTAILLSGGVGSRLSSDIPKQYMQVGGRMLITYALAALAAAPAIDRILIVAGREWHESIIADAEKGGISTGRVMGFGVPGFNRQSSVINGMQEILRQISSGVAGEAALEGGWGGSGHVEKWESSGMADGDTVFIHDAARPLLSQKQVSECFVALAGHDGVMPVLPMKDTVYLSRNRETVSELLDRNQIFSGQAPELFCFKKYYQANTVLTPERLALINGSTEPAILAGMDIVMIPGDENNFKITTLQDLERFHRAVGIC